MILDSVKFAAIVEDAKLRAAAEAVWVRAIERAAEAIEAGEMIVTVLTHGAIVTTEGGTYRANGACQCEAAKRGHAACKHRAAARLMAIYEGAQVEIASAEPLSAVASAA